MQIQYNKNKEKEHVKTVKHTEKLCNTVMHNGWNSVS